MKSFYDAIKFYLLSLALILVLLSACAVDRSLLLPELTGVEKRTEKHICAAVFPRGKWQFVHSIDFTTKDGFGNTLLGVTTLAGSTIESALITVEGLTLFEASFGPDDSYQVRRAVPPFDGPALAKNMIGDIRAIFQPPPGILVRTGLLAGAVSACRYEEKGRVTDILPDVDDCWQIKSYSSDLILDRSIVGRSCREKGSRLIPDYLELKTYGRTGYTLKMTLISADNFK
jgi:hypothetical protein